MFKSKRLKDCTLSELTTIWNDAFSYYEINIHMTVDQIALMIGKSELSPEHSIVIYDNMVPIGFVLTSIKTIDGTKMAWNGGTGVSQSYQGRGIGKLLMNELMEVYQKNGVQLATLEVLKNNAGAISLYEKYGFKKTDSLSVLEFIEQNTANQFNPENVPYLIEKGLAADVKELPFHNKNVAWSHQSWNIQNGQSIIIKDQNHMVIGYCLFNEFTRLNGEHVIMLHQCEIQPSISKKKVILEQLVSALYREAKRKNASMKTGDFTSSSEEVVPFLQQIGFQTVADRFLMTAKIEKYAELNG